MRLEFIIIGLILALLVLVAAISFFNLTPDVSNTINGTLESKNIPGFGRNSPTPTTDTPVDCRDINDEHECRIVNANRCVWHTTQYECLHR